MSSRKEVRLRGKSQRRDEYYPLGEIPTEVVTAIAKQIVHRMAIGNSDISGDDFGTIFATAIDGIHKESPLGIADVVRENENCAWSVKTIKSDEPQTQESIRLISGRNSPDYSSGISDPRKNPAETGKAVLDIWNARVNEALDDFNDLRILVLVRNFSTREFLIFEEEATRFTHRDYEWKFNKRGNLEGREISSNEHRFTWQPHGSQFTIKRSIPAHAKAFSISREVPVIEMESVLESISYAEDWISIDE